MSDILIQISVLANLASIILGIVGFYLVIKNWLVWKNTSLEIIKARAFLNKEFLENNWFYVVAAGGFIMIRRIYRYFELTIDKGIYQFIETLFDVLGFLVILLLVLMAYQWYRIIQSHPMD